jgi:hypothetical protein
MVDLAIKIELSAVIVAVVGNEPRIVIDPQNALPSGPFETEHRTMEQGLRAWAGLPLGYVEQLYTFADRDRRAGNKRVVSIGYLALLRPEAEAAGALWSSWYKHLPWEDHRKDGVTLISQYILPQLAVWKNKAPDTSGKRLRAERIAIAFPTDKKLWNEELVLQRYELLWEAGLVPESPHHRASAKPASLGGAMAHDHRRILATAMARLRAKIKYRPVVFELMPDSFTLLQLQETVEALAGLKLHKPNFRRLIEGQGLVEETGAVTRGASGRPAKLFAFRRETVRERAVTGTKPSRSF